jgi:hypothetical protein
MTRPRVHCQTAPSFGGGVSAFAPQLLHAGPDRWKIVRGARPSALAAQLLHAGADGRKVVGGARSSHVFSDFLFILK